MKGIASPKKEPGGPLSKPPRSIVCGELVLEVELHGELDDAVATLEQDLAEVVDAVLGE